MPGAPGPRGFLYLATVLDVCWRGHPLQFGPLWTTEHRETRISRHPDLGLRLNSPLHNDNGIRE
jgi:hypothetical protein